MGLSALKQVVPAVEFSFEHVFNPTYIYIDPANCKTSIVAVHGLRSCATGTLSDSWLQNVLVPRYTNAQISIFEHELPLPTQVSFPDTSQHPWHTIKSLGSELVYALVHRDTTKAPRRPLFFICQGFGGLIVKHVSLSIRCPAWELMERNSASIYHESRKNQYSPIYTIERPQSHSLEQYTQQTTPSLNQTLRSVPL